jgi:hypothetical protein
MEISRNVILDLLPLYFANELSEDSRALVEKHLEDDPQLAKLAKQREPMALSEKIPVPLTQNDELIAYRKAKQIIMWRTIAIGVVIAIFLLLVMTMFFYSDPPSDNSRSTADQGIHLRTPFGLAVEGLDNLREISWTRCKTADSHAAEHEPDARTVCIPIPKQKDGYSADRCPTRTALTKNMKNA